MTSRISLTTTSVQRAGHERVLAAVKHSLAEGLYEGGMLPSYRQLVRDLKVSMASVRRAMAQLEREGVVRRESGRGTIAREYRHSGSRKKSVQLQCINFVARSFALLPGFVDADYLLGYTAALERLGIQIRFVAWNELDPDYGKLCSPILPMEAQGVILINEYPLNLVEWLRRNRLPFVVQYYTRYVTEGLPPHYGIYVNKAGGASQAVNHLLELGHRDIGYMGVIDRADSIVLAEGTVFEGYRAALICAGLACSERLLAACSDKEEGRSSIAVAKAFLNRPQRPTAVLAECDEFARALLEAARALNLRVPEDVSIVGFDNQPRSAQTDPPLTTVSVPRRELARSAVELLLQAAEEPKPQPRMHILDTHLIIRETTAPPRAAHSDDSSAALPAQS